MSHCLGSFYTHLSKKNVHTAFIFIQLVRLKVFFVVFITIKSLQSQHQQRLLFFGQDYLITIIIIFTSSNELIKQTKKLIFATTTFNHEFTSFFSFFAWLMIYFCLSNLLSLSHQFTPPFIDKILSEWKCLTIIT